jgi:hypothetical protein
MRPIREILKTNRSKREWARKMKFKVLEQ